jgi:hypothetical protein
MVDGFDPEFLGMLVVSARPEGRYAILDGRNRAEVCRRVGWADAIFCEVHTGLTRAEEAKLYDFYNRKTAPSALSKFHARAIWGDPPAVEIDRIVRAHGWRIEPGKDHGHFRAVSAVEGVYRGAGVLTPGEYPDLVDAVVTVVTDAWGHDAGAPHENIVRGLGTLLARRGVKGGEGLLDGVVDVKRLSMTLSGVDPSDLVRDARSLARLQSSSNPSAMAAKVTALYNKRSRKASTRLPDWTWTR